METVISREMLERAWALAEDFEPGLYGHHKGGRYSALMVITHHETRMPMVVYVSHTYGGANVRPLVGYPGDPDGFIDVVSIKEGVGISSRRRFIRLGSLPSDIPLKER